MADPLAGINNVGPGWPIVFFTDLDTGSYSMWYQPDPIVFPNDWSNAGSILVTSNGTYNTFGFSSALGVEPEDYVVTSGGVPDPDGNPGGMLESFSMGFSGDSTINPYILENPALTATPGDGHVDLDWTEPDSSSDARAELIYAVRRNTSSPPASVVASHLTALTYDDTGLANGATYYHRVVVDMRILGSAEGMSVGRLSNITASTVLGDPEDVVFSFSTKAHRT